MTDTITLTGLVATVPRSLTTAEGLPITSFRLASTQRRFDRAKQSWVDGETNWYTVTTFRRLAANAALSIAKGQRVVVTGRLRLRDWETAEKKGLTVEIDAEALGHDLMWGTSSFTRNLMIVSDPGSPGSPGSPGASEPEGTASGDGAAPGDGGGESASTAADPEGDTAWHVPVDAAAVPF